MELYDNLIRLIDVNIIYCLISLILTLLIIELIFKNRFKTKQILNLVRWGIIIYTTVGLIHYVIGYLWFTKEFEFIGRATGPYWIFYWLMLFSSTILPYSLLFRKLKDRPWYLLFIAFSMKLGVYFERFVLIVINFHRDYVPRSWSFKTFGFPTHEFLMIFLQGFLLAILLLVLYEFVDRKINKQSATSL